MRAEGLLPLFCADRLVPRLILESEFWSLGGSCKFHSTRLCESTGYVMCLKVTGLTSGTSGAFLPGSQSPDLALLLCCVRRTDVMSPAPPKGDEVRDQLHACAPLSPRCIRQFSMKPTSVMLHSSLYAIQLASFSQVWLQAATKERVSPK